MPRVFRQGHEGKGRGFETRAGAASCHPCHHLRMHAERPEGEPGRDEAANRHGANEPDPTRDPDGPEGASDDAGENGLDGAGPTPPDAAAADSADAAGHESVYSLLQRGQELMRRRHNAQAAVVLERAARAEPGKGSILEALGRAYYNSGQHDRSRATFEELLDVDPSAHYAHYALGQSLKQLGRAKEARTHLRLAVALSPGSALYRGALNRLGPPAED